MDSIRVRRRWRGVLSVAAAAGALLLGAAAHSQSTAAGPEARATRRSEREQQGEEMRGKIQRMSPAEREEVLCRAARAA